MAEFAPPCMPAVQTADDADSRSELSPRPDGVVTTAESRSWVQARQQCWAPSCIIARDPDVARAKSHVRQMIHVLRRT